MKLRSTAAVSLMLSTLALACGGTPSPKDPPTMASAAASAEPAASSLEQAPSSTPSAEPAPSAAPAASAAPTASAAPSTTAAPTAPVTLAALVDAGDPEAGKTLYEAQHCGGCHGTKDKPSKKFPNLFKVDWAKAGEIDHAFAIVKKGDAPMPAYGDKLDDKQIGSIVAFLRAK
jgi:mono/diheme cytochrome c family protein